MLATPFAPVTQPAALAGFTAARRIEPAMRLDAPRPPLLRQRHEPQQLSLFGPPRIGR